MSKALKVAWTKAKDGTSMLLGTYGLLLGSVRPQGDRFRVMLQQSMDPSHYCWAESEEKGQLLVELHNKIVEVSL